MTDRDRYTIGYRELRALVEDLLRPPPAVEPSGITAALGEHLRTHCRNCGELIDQLPRQQGGPTHRQRRATGPDPHGRQHWGGSPVEEEEMTHPRHMPLVPHRGDQRALSETAFAWMELRALVQDLLTTTDRATRHRLCAAITQLFMSRCAQCGALLPQDDRADPLADLCLACHPASVMPITAPDDDEVPF
jgi:hypothetical protein